MIVCLSSSGKRAGGERVARGFVLCHALISLLMRAASIGDSSAQHPCQSRSISLSPRPGERNWCISILISVT